MNVLLIGAPGSGKGTQGQRLSAILGMSHIATGDLLRQQVSDKTPLGLEVAGYLERGELVPDQVIIDLVLPLVAEAAASQGYLLDGFPRSVDQAEQVRAIAAAQGAGADAAIYLDAPREALTARLLERARIEGRSDDTEEVIANRLQIFDSETSPLVEYYRSRGLLHIVDATLPPEEVTNQILRMLDSPE